MDVYIYAADIYCEDCGRAIRERIISEGNAPADYDDETSYDSDEFPKGPFSDGGGESDCPQHCASCGVFLENPLTSDGYDYVREQHAAHESEITAMWCEFYDVD